MSKISDILSRVTTVAAAMVTGAFSGALLWRSFEETAERLTPEQKMSQLKDIAAWVMEFAERRDQSMPTCHTPECKRYGHGYMLTDDVWKKATGGDGAICYLCLTCVHERLGRRLRIADFTDVPINEPIRAVLFGHFEHLTPSGPRPVGMTVEDGS